MNMLEKAEMEAYQREQDNRELPWQDELMRDEQYTQWLEKIQADNLGYQMETDNASQHQG